MEEPTLAARIIGVILFVLLILSFGANINQFYKSSDLKKQLEDGISFNQYLSRCTHERDQIQALLKSYRKVRRSGCKNIRVYRIALDSYSRFVCKD